MVRLSSFSVLNAARSFQVVLSKIAKVCQTIRCPSRNRESLQYTWRFIDTLMSSMRSVWSVECIGKRKHIAYEDYAGCDK